MTEECVRRVVRRVSRLVLLELAARTSRSSIGNCMHAAARDASGTERASRALGHRTHMDNDTTGPAGTRNAPDAASPDEVARISADAAAFERVTMPYVADVARFARSLTRDATRADDLVQETYLQALRGWHTFQPGSEARPWLFAICHHAFLRTMRHESRYVDVPDDGPEFESAATAKAHWRAQQAGVAEIVEQMDLGRAIDRALTKLPPQNRGAVVLVDVEGLSYEGASLILGAPVGTVRSRLFRGRRLLQDLLFDYARDAGFEAARPPADASFATPVSHVGPQ